MGQEEYVDKLLRASTRHRRHPMGRTIERQSLVYLSCVEVTKVRRSIEQSLTLDGLRPSQGDAKRVVEAVTRPICSGGGAEGSGMTEERSESPPPCKVPRRSTPVGVRSTPAGAKQASSASAAEPDAAAEGGEPRAKVKAKANAKAKVTPEERKHVAACKKLEGLAGAVDAEQQRAEEAGDHPMAKGSLAEVDKVRDLLREQKALLEQDGCDVDAVQAMLKKVQLRVNNLKRNKYVQ